MRKKTLLLVAAIAGTCTNCVTSVNIYIFFYAICQICSSVCNISFAI